MLFYMWLCQISLWSNSMSALTFWMSEEFDTQETSFVYKLSPSPHREPCLHSTFDNSPYDIWMQSLHYLGDILSINSDSASPYIIEAVQQANDGAFSWTRRPNLCWETGKDVRGDAGCRKTGRTRSPSVVWILRTPTVEGHYYSPLHQTQKCLRDHWEKPFRMVELFFSPYQCEGLSRHCCKGNIMKNFSPVGTKETSRPLLKTFTIMQRLPECYSAHLYSNPLQILWSVSHWRLYKHGSFYERTKEPTCLLLPTIWTGPQSVFPFSTASICIAAQYIVNLNIWVLFR